MEKKVIAFLVIFVAATILLTVFITLLPVLPYLVMAAAALWLVFRQPFIRRGRAAADLAWLGSHMERGAMRIVDAVRLKAGPPL